MIIEYTKPVFTPICKSCDFKVKLTTIVTYDNKRTGEITVFGKTEQEAETRIKIMVIE